MKFIVKFLNLLVLRFLKYYFSSSVFFILMVTQNTTGNFSDFFIILILKFANLFLKSIFVDFLFSMFY